MGYEKKEIATAPTVLTGGYRTGADLGCQRHEEYGFSTIISHCSQRRSCFNKLSTNGVPSPRKLFSVRPEPVEGRPVWISLNWKP